MLVSPSRFGGNAKLTIDVRCFVSPPPLPPEPLAPWVGYQRKLPPPLVPAELASEGVGPPLWTPRVGPRLHRQIACPPSWLFAVAGFAVLEVGFCSELVAANLRGGGRCVPCDVCTMNPPHTDLINSIKIPVGKLRLELAIG